MKDEIGKLFKTEVAGHLFSNTFHFLQFRDFQLEILASLHSAGAQASLCSVDYQVTGSNFVRLRGGFFIAIHVYNLIVLVAFNSLFNYVGM
jgi:hypothetical protein